ncbi:hypothetical protein QLX08_002330 [Tetragonisca angustula]|uniref:Uncharacterized protein n=1 Tax=Tetragonisca angustula TaxID=166442 RepID=A0AAW1ADU7_9HYME
MPHCTDNFVWYLSKFIAGFTGMLFFYVVFLKEREQTCLCKARMREFLRRRGENTNTCPLDNQADVDARKEFGPKSMIAAVENVWTWCTKIREWFHENDPSIVSEIASALGKSLPKNDNGNFDFPSKSLRNIGKLYVLCDNAQPENQACRIGYEHTKETIG